MPTPDALVGPLLAWYAQVARDLPWRRTSDPYAIWISEIMLQQTQVKTVMSYWHRWMCRFPTVRALAKANFQDVLKSWEGLGYYARARNLHRAARIMVRKHSGALPRGYRELIALPGIGRYTAGAICSIAFNQPEPILDGNVIRVLTRIFAIDRNPRETQTNQLLWELARRLVERAPRVPHPPPRPCSDLNQALMELGATVCAPRQPNCPICPVRRECTAYRTGRTAELPRPSSRPQTLSRRVLAFVISRNGRFLLKKRPARSINAHLWEFPNLEAGDTNFDLETMAKRCVGFRPRALRPLCSLNHTITHFRIHVDVFLGAMNKPLPRTSVSVRWCTLGQVDELPLPNAHRRIAERLGALLKNAGATNVNRVGRSLVEREL
ncbi:MAG: A/G-specific adenine glycosylase [Verrucomicrobia bacterium]|nr:A/G-specific adenine glycosylase [Verrucomicrobiota bacterium]